MNNKKIMFIAVLCVGLSACGGEKSNETSVKAAFLNNCISQESSTRSVEQAKSYCDCAADEVFSSSNISDETKKLMPNINDKSSKLYTQSDFGKVKGLLMSCYTKKFYKKS